MPDSARTWSVIDLAIAKIAAALPAIGSGLVVMLVFWLVAWLLAALARRVMPKHHPGAARLVALFGSVLFWGLTILGVICGLGTMGVNVGALIAGLGLTGFGVGLAMKDAVANVVSGVLILLYRPFTYGDRITVSGVAGAEGGVSSIDLRYTTLETDDARVFVPNQTMFSNPVIVKRRGPLGEAGRPPG